MNKDNFFKNLIKKINDSLLSVSLEEKVLFTRHLAIMVKAGMPLIEALRMLQKQTRNRSLSVILTQVVADVNNGQFLSASLDKYTKVFGNFFINIIRIGESGGILSENLNYLSDELKKRRELRKKVISAMIYPSIIVIVATGLVTMLTVFIFPKILPVFYNLNVKLPATTRALIVISDFLQAYGLAVLGGMVLIPVLATLLKKIKAVKYSFDRSLMYLFLVKGISQSVNLSNFCRTLGLLLKSGMKIVEALTITADTINNTAYRRELEQMAAGIQKGEQLSHFLQNKERLFPAMLVNMIAVGENTGNLSDTLLYLADFYESELNELTKNLSAILEPILILIIGAVVGFVALAVITPIYGITQSVSG